MSVLFVMVFSALPRVEARSEAVVGVPMIQARLSMDFSHNVNLDNNQKMTNRLVIMKDEGKYYWETRDRRELIYQKMKRFDLFIDLKTGGYIKVVQQADGRYVYTEHLTIQGLKGFSYWGIVNLYQP
ncbi:MAG: hypothetical protein ACE5F7_01755 [Nitrospiria bacterium]